MRFWDSSAIVPLVVQEVATPWARETLDADRNVLVWALSPIEVRSALARRAREGVIKPAQARDARARTAAIFAAFSEVVLLSATVERAMRLVDSHPLRAADALQLAAALIASHDRPSELAFVTLDKRLADAAEREGFQVILRTG